MVALRILGLPVLNWPFLDLLGQLDSANVTARDRAHWYLISVAPEARKPQPFDTPYRVDTLVNIKDWCKNSFEVVKQLRINTDNSHHRYNVILLINGITAVQIELKTLGISPRRAMEQIVDYKNDPGNGYSKTILCFVQLFIVSNRTDTWYFANNNARHFASGADERFLPIHQFRGRGQCKDHPLQRLRRSSIWSPSPASRSAGGLFFK
jgi:hypothetical protein